MGKADNKTTDDVHALFGGAREVMNSAMNDFETAEELNCYDVLARAERKEAAALRLYEMAKAAQIAARA